MAKTVYEIVETSYTPTKKQPKLDFLGELGKAEALARSEAAKNLGMGCAIFSRHGWYDIS